MTANPTTRVIGKTKIDSLWVDSSAWYIDGTKVTASATDLNEATGTYPVYNATGGAFTAGMPLHVSGYDATSGYFKVEKADADAGKMCHLFAVGTTANGSTGTATQYYKGTGNGVDCSAGAAIGDPVYLSATVGTLTLTAPTATNAFVQVVGRVGSILNPGTLVLESDFQERTKIGTNEIQDSSLGIAQMANDDAGSVFIIAKEHDFHLATAKDTSLGTMAAKGTLIGGYITVTEACDSTATTDTIIIGTAASGGTPIAQTATITVANTDFSNAIGKMFGINQLAAGIDIASGATIYAYTGADTGAAARAHGKVWVFLMFQKSA
jgi:hypothetical protein